MGASKFHKKIISPSKPVYLTFADGLYPSNTNLKSKIPVFAFKTNILVIHVIVNNEIEEQII